MTLGRKNGYKEISEEPDAQFLCLDQDELYITGHRTNTYKVWTFYALGVLLFGIPVLLLYWYPKLIHFKLVRTSLRCADHVLVKDLSNAYSVHPVQKFKICCDNLLFEKPVNCYLKAYNEIRYFIHKDIKYIWVDEDLGFHALTGWDDGTKCVNELLENSVGYSSEEQDLLLKIYGKNEIKISIPSSWSIVFNEILRPFYLFQFFSITLWLLNDYLSYAVCVVILTSTSVCITLYSTKKQRKSLQILAGKTSPAKVHVIRKGGVVEEIDPCFLVPGDVIQIPRTGCNMPCDALLLHGNCIVNEYTLTGESCPVTKTPPTSTPNLFNSIIHKRHVLFCGTEVVQTRYYGEGTVTAVTVSTGFSTTKGELIRCLLHPKPLGFKFEEDSIKLVFFLFFVATCGIFYLSYVCFKRSIPIKTLVYDSLDLITVVVPPALPAALSAGIAYSRSRLLSKKIFCVSPPKINLFGKLKLMCFDKTGTLTEEGLDLWGILPCSHKKFTSLIEKPSVLNPKHSMVVALATCHTLTKIDGKISGNPVDLSMFNSLNWELYEPGNDTSRYDLLCPTIVKPKLCREKSLEIADNEELPYEIGIVREFPFTSASRCMSVITRELGADHMNLYCKGAPEKIWELCKPDSLPDNFNEELQMYASMGFRVLGVGYKEFDQKFTWRKSQRVKREEVETELKFLGLIIMQNKLKPVSTGVMNDLRMANIRCVMITGDNLLTAISVSRECFMVLPGDNIIEVKVTPSCCPDTIPTLSFHPIEPINTLTRSGFSKPSEDFLKTHSSEYHYAMDGKTWELLKIHFSDLIPKIIVRGTIFSRMLPEQKTQLVEAFQDLEYIVGMCGDGANDYGAMKAAHVGVSLSETESSVVAPFTSKIQDVSCIVTLVQEGRCALISTFVIFKYMTIYSLIQFMSVVIIYENNIAFSNMEYLYVDLIVTSLLAVVMGRTGPSKVVIKTRPIARLMSFDNLFPLFLQIIVLFFVEFCALQFLYEQSWFIPVVSDSDDAVTICWENTVIYCVSLFQYLILALVYSKGKPYRLPFYSDRFFILVFIAMTTFAILLTVYPFQALAKVFSLVSVENDTPRQRLFRVELLMFPLLNLLLSFLIEASTSNQKWLKNVIHFLKRKKECKNKYKRILKDPCYPLV